MNADLESMMPNTRTSRAAVVGALIGLIGLAPQTGRAQALEPIIYNLKVPAPATHIAEVDAIIPTGGHASIEIMMAVWSPGFYRVEDYAQRVQGLAAQTTDGAPLAVESTRKNRWRVQTEAAGQSRCLLSAHLRTKVRDHQLCGRRPGGDQWRPDVRHPGRAGSPAA